jgi:hypothetical protein
VSESRDGILEFGAGSGILAAQILFELGRLGKLPKNFNFTCVFLLNANTLKLSPIALGNTNCLICCAKLMRLF